MEINIVQPEEIDFFVQSVKKYQVQEIGGKSWLEGHERLVKLNQQAVLEASGSREEIVKELLIIQDKLPTLVHEAYCVLVWRTKILPNLLKSAEISSTFFMYTVLFHETIAVSLLETVLFHDNSCESLGDIVVDLIDYCAHGITQLIGLVHAGHHLKEIDTKSEVNPVEEIKTQKNDVLYVIGIKCITILSYLCDKMSTLSTSVARRVTQTHDVPCMVSEVLAVRPWLRRIKHFEKFIDGKWTMVEGDEILKVVKVEAQAWFCLRSIMFHRETFENYEINSFRQRELGKCSGLLNEVILDQLPPLAELKQFLCTLQPDTHNSLNNLVLEVVPEIKDKIMEKAEKAGWSSIVERHKKLFVEMSEHEVVEMAKRLSEAYNFDVMTEIEENQPKNRETLTKSCATCQSEAEKKCSRCEVVYYCSRECQVKDWINHKEKCYQYVA